MWSTKEFAKRKNDLLVRNARVFVSVTSDVATNASIHLRYMVGKAQWMPLYSIRAEKDKSTMLIEYQANIYNDTGVDWSNVPLTLALLDASKDIVKPSLPVWELDGEKAKT